MSWSTHRGLGRLEPLQGSSRSTFPTAERRQLTHSGGGQAVLDAGEDGGSRRGVRGPAVVGAGGHDGQQAMTFQAVIQVSLQQVGPHVADSRTPAYECEGGDEGDGGGGKQAAH